ncbi:hypothetical protein E2C01_008504 [Portunus trituberculatus]|uniref:Uncharacterized protein n=1 Tax=Portunus trituberculatus TaxID=210409 RepID=A0A5B7D314_PORTR|nr:hypothetical protein [Portunus trituberculatus]
MSFFWGKEVEQQAGRRGINGVVGVAEVRQEAVKEALAQYQSRPKNLPLPSKRSSVMTARSPDRHHRDSDSEDSDEDSVTAEGSLGSSGGHSGSQGTPEVTRTPLLLPPPQVPSHGSGGGTPASSSSSSHHTPPHPMQPKQQQPLPPVPPHRSGRPPLLHCLTLQAMMEADHGYRERERERLRLTHLRICNKNNYK